jgi:chromosome segregation ATPase
VIQTLSSENSVLRDKIKEGDEMIASLNSSTQQLQVEIDEFTAELNTLTSQSRLEELRIMQEQHSKITALKKAVQEKDETIKSLNEQLKTLSEAESLQMENVHLKTENEKLLQLAQSARDEATAVKTTYARNMSELQTRIEEGTKKEEELQKLCREESQHIESLADAKVAKMRSAMSAFVKSGLNSIENDHKASLKKLKQKHLAVMISTLLLSIGSIASIMLLSWFSDELRLISLLPVIIYLIIQVIYIGLRILKLWQRHTH